MTPIDNLTIEQLLEMSDETTKKIPLYLMDEGFVTRCDKAALGETILIEKHKGYILSLLANIQI